MYREIVYNDHHKLYILIVTLLLLIVMSDRISQKIKNKVIKECLTGKSRNEIAAETNIADGSVGGIIFEWKKGLQDPQYQDVRELAGQSRQIL